MAKTENKSKPASMVFVGEVEATQIVAWKKSLGVDSILKIKVVKSENETGVCYLKPADRKIASLAYQYIGQKNFVKAGEVFMSNCWLGGDEDIKNIDRLYLSACLAAYETLDIAESEAEKL